MKLAASGQVHDDLFYDRADLNGDGQVDLADVACFAKYYKEDARTAREIRTMRITEEEIHTASASNAEISQGTVEQLFSGAASLTLESEEAISGENPVTISAEFGSGKTMAGFVIDPVSYTHLDVYKRQGHKARRTGASMSQAGGKPRGSAGRRISVHCGLHAGGPAPEWRSPSGPGPPA